MVIGLKNKRTLAWEYNPEIIDASKLKDDNLFILDENKKVIWNMIDAINIHDVAVNLDVNENSFTFITFNGLSIEIDIDTLKVIDKKVTK